MTSYQNNPDETRAGGADHFEESRSAGILWCPAQKPLNLY